MLNSQLRTSLIRAALITAMASPFVALAPMFARETLDAGADSNGMLLAAFGIGSVTGGLMLGRLRSRLSTESAIRLLSLLLGGASLLAGIADTLLVGCIAYLLGGLGYTSAVTLLNVTIQMRAPRPVAARAIATLQSAVAGAIAIGSWGWGAVATITGIQAAMAMSGGAVILTCLYGLVQPVVDPPDARV